MSCMMTLEEQIEDVSLCVDEATFFCTLTVYFFGLPLPYCVCATGSAEEQPARITTGHVAWWR
jgi:hypothetical protein